MTKAERALLQRAKRRAANLEPALQRAYLKALDNLIASTSPAELERYIRSGEVERLIEKLESDLKQAARPFTKAMQDAVQAATVQMAREIPAALRKTVEGIRFDWLNPRVIDAVKQLDDRMMRGLQEQVRETVRAQVETGLRAGINPRTVARHLDLKLAPNQALAIENYRKALESGEAAKALSYKLRDARYDKSVMRGALDKAKIDKMVDAYARRMRAFNAETQARTAALDATRMGQRMSIEDAIEKGIYDRSILYKKWVTAHDDRVREEHQEMEGEIARYDQEFSNGEMIPGESTYNCRCIAVYFEEPNAELIQRSEAARLDALKEKQERQAA